LVLATKEEGEEEEELGGEEAEIKGDVFCGGGVVGLVEEEG
jgi:hypothetical protein